MEISKSLLVIANWKMNPRTREEARALVADLKKSIRVTGATEVVIAPPFVYLDEVKKGIGAGKLLLGAQNVSGEKLGAFTGDISVSMLESMGVTHIIVGHSERRAQGETDADVEKKVGGILKTQLTAVICVGERERDSHGKYFGLVETQVRAALKGVPGSKLPHVAIAYEPIWAISTASTTAHAATPEDAHEMVLFIRKVLTDLYGRSNAEKVRILYGGSVDIKNIEPLVAHSGAQGFLVGGASLRPADFSLLVKVAQSR